MTPEDIYEIAPDIITDEMLTAARKLLTRLLQRPPEFDELVAVGEALLETAKAHYRTGAFNMEHREGKTCQAEDQGGWPCCSQPAEFFIKDEHLRPGEKAPIYCGKHGTDEGNRFYRADQMAPIYENPSGKKEG